MTIRFGPAYLGGVKEAEKNLRHFASLGLKACEIPFTYSVYIKKEEDAKRIGKLAKELGIRLSIHAPYWVNLNSSEPEKIKRTKERILNCCRVGTWLGVYRVVFHPGYYGDDKEKAYENIKAGILDLQKTVKEKGYTPKLAPEMMGKVNVFGSVEEIHKLVEETGCEFCIDFAHILAREKKYRFEEVLNLFKKYKEMHIHFSGIEYGEKGEKHHKKTPVEAWKKLLAALPKDKEITIINESPSTVEDSVEGMEILGVTHS
jgi:deoxyribonuclease-4